MRAYIKKMALLPILVILGLAFITISGIAKSTASNKGINGEKPLVSDVLQQTPDLMFIDENGKTISLRSLKGKVVFINLWATWCPPCIYEMPSINKLRNTFKDNDDLVFLMVDVDGKINQAKKFMERRKFDLPVHIPANEIPRELFGGSIPTTIIVNKQNDIVGRHVGGADYAAQEVIDMMSKLLNEND